MTISYARFSELNKLRCESPAFKKAHDQLAADGYSISDFIGYTVSHQNQPKESPLKGRKAEIKYQDSGNKDNTWTGRGHTPNWIIEKANIKDSDTKAIQEAKINAVLKICKLKDA